MADRSVEAAQLAPEDDAEAVAARPGKWWLLGAVSVSTFMLLLDVTVVNVALPDMQRTLNSSFADLQWVIDAYALSLAAFLLSAGTLADQFGRRRVFGYGLVIFTLASLLCGLAPNPPTPCKARAPFCTPSRRR
jgi:MFS family permease